LLSVDGMAQGIVLITGSHRCFGWFKEGEGVRLVPLHLKSVMAT
jgi:hypothetical protein